jgi:peptide/nickel transport system substrate-binding protein
MARRIRWQLVIAVTSALLVTFLLGRLALRAASDLNPLAGGTYVETLVGAPVQPIPLLNDPLVDPSGQAMIALLYDGLMRIGSDGLLEPAIAASYQIDPTETVYTFQLRRDVRWHDGTPLTADDVVFTLRMLQSSEDLGDPLLARFWQDVLVDRIDDYTVRCTLTAPFAPFLSLARVPIVPVHLLGAQPIATWSETEYAQQLVGTGPYRLVEVREDLVRLTANPDYFGGAPYIEEVELRFVAAPEAGLVMLQRGEAVAFSTRASLELDGVALPDGMRRIDLPLDEYAVLSFNLEQPPLDDVSLRRSLAYGLDREALIERALRGLGAPIDTPILPGSWAANPDLEWYEPDAVLAGQLLNELGYEPGIGGTRQREGQVLRFELIVDDAPARVAAANEIAEQWAAIGVEVTVNQLDPTQMLERLQNRDFMLALHSWVRVGPDPDAFALWHSSRAENGLNYAGLRDPRIDVLLDEARRTSELASRSADYAEFQQRWIELTPSIVLYQPLYSFFVSDQIGGVELADPQSATSLVLFGSEDRYRTIQRWFLNSYRELEGDLQ